MLINENSCPVCRNDTLKYCSLRANSTIIEIICEVCGKFSITDQAIRQIIESHNKYILSGVIRDASESGKALPDLLTTNINDYLSENLLPSTFLERLDNILKFIVKHIKYIGEPTPLNVKLDYPIAFAKNKNEFQEMVILLENMDYLAIDNSALDEGILLCTPTIKGWVHIDEIKHKLGEGTQCFVAMSFDPSLDEIYSEGIDPGIRASGYVPFRIDKKEHNEKICDKIIAEIRNSRLLIADFSGHKNGVYFEAGLAMGLGIPVIWTCRKNEIEETHFDTRQYNHILWESAEELKDKLRDRILATVPLK